MQLAHPVSCLLNYMCIQFRIHLTTYLLAHPKSAQVLNSQLCGFTNSPFNCRAPWKSLTLGRRAGARQRPCWPRSRREHSYLDSAPGKRKRSTSKKKLQSTKLTNLLSTFLALIFLKFQVPSKFFTFLHTHDSAWTIRALCLLEK